nr:hypothetical protein [Methylobacterium sp. L1A1]
MTLQELRDMAEPGAWRDYIDRVIEGQAAHEAVYEANKAGYGRFYDSPAYMTSALDGGEVAAVEAIESSSAHFVELRDGIYAARITAFATKAAELGAEAPRKWEPAWVRLMRDLQEPRVWRVKHLDGVDLHLPPFVLRACPSRGRRPACSIPPSRHGRRPSGSGPPISTPG